MHQHYDYIIAGAGAAGLSLAWRLMQSPLSEKKVLVVDANLTPTYDKTWCFWDHQAPPFADIIYKQWDKVELGIEGQRFAQPLRNYPYYCLRNVDFQNKILNALRSNSQFHLLESDIIRLQGDSESPTLQTPEGSYSADYIFQSCFDPWQANSDQPHYPLWQHFLGWEIKLPKPLLAADTFTLMDFDETFDEGIAFVYLLPWSRQAGLIEYTIFSDRVLSSQFYEEKLSLYLNNRFDLKPLDYQIERREFGKIPMVDRPPLPWYQPRIMNLGTMGGVTKPSTGYTFRRIQQHTADIVNRLSNNGSPEPPAPSQWRYRAYDLWLLQIIHDHPRDALRVFQRLFQNNAMDDVFRFLAEESSYLQDLEIMSSVPYWPFLRAIWETRGRLTEL